MRDRRVPDSCATDIHAVGFKLDKLAARTIIKNNRHKLVRVRIDVCYAGTAAAGKSLIEDKKWGRNVPSDRSAAMAAQVQTMELRTH